MRKVVSLSLEKWTNDFGTYRNNWYKGKDWRTLYNSTSPCYRRIIGTMYLNNNTNTPITGEWTLMVPLIRNAGVTNDDNNTRWEIEELSHIMNDLCSYSHIPGWPAYNTDPEHHGGQMDEEAGGYWFRTDRIVSGNAPWWYYEYTNQTFKMQRFSEVMDYLDRWYYNRTKSNGKGFNILDSNYSF